MFPLKNVFVENFAFKNESQIKWCLSWCKSFMRWCDMEIDML